MMSSKRTGEPCGPVRRLGAASIAQASEAQEARIARFSLSVRSGSSTTSDGCPKAFAGCKSSSRLKLSSLLAAMSFLPSTDHQRRANSLDLNAARFGFLDLRQFQRQHAVFHFGGYLVLVDLA